MIEKELAAEILSEALKFGGEFSEIFVENNVKDSITVTNGKTEKSISGREFGIGIRIFSNGKAIYSFTNDLSKDNLLKIARDASKAAALNGGVSETKTVSADFNEKKYFDDKNMHKVLKKPTDGDRSVIADILKSASEVAFKYNSLITQTGMSHFSSCQDIIIANSDGLWVEDRRIRTRAFVNVIASSESEKQRGYFGPGGLVGLELYDKISLDEIARDAANSAVKMLKADFCPCGRFPVVIANGFGGVIFHEACGHALEAAAVAKNASVFSDKINMKIANEKVTAIDDGTIKNMWGSINVDDEGVPTRRNVLIENGILKSYMVDTLNGMKMGIPSTGSSRRESYKYMPVSRMTNTFIAAGDDSMEDIISSVDYGIYAKHMGGGSVNPVSGEFNFAVSEAYIIRKGKIAEPVRGATLIGKGHEVLMNIDMVSGDLSLESGMCGASSGSVPVTVGQPMIRVSEITVGGRK